MKKFALGMLAAVAMTGTAFAADMAPRYTKAPPPAPIALYNWTGCYIGAKTSKDYSFDLNTKSCVLKSEAATPSSKDFFANWGVGLGVIHNSPRVVSDAAIVTSGGTSLVRANAQQQWTSELLLVRHFYFH